jgi:chorismate mutase
MGVRGIRGAITVSENDSQEMLEATKELVLAMIANNRIEAEEVASVLITVTQDLDAAFPAKSIRELVGWEFVPLMCSTEIPVPGSLEKCIRVMMLVNTDLKAKEVNHVFLREAIKLRPDLVHRND